MNVGTWVQWWADIAPESRAMVFGDQVLTYRAMNARINRIGHALLREGVERGDRVAVLLTNAPEYLEIFFACARIGATFVPLNIRLAQGELAYIVDNAEPSLLISEGLFADTLEGVADRIELPSLVSLDGERPGRAWLDFLEDVPDDKLSPDLASWDDNLAICYTSGTTGRPKGAVLTHGSIFYSTVQCVLGYGFDQRDCHLMALPLCFTGGLIPASMPAFHSGGTMVLEKQFDPARALKLIPAEQVSVMMAVPTMFQLMQQHPSFEDADLSSFRVAMSGGAPVPVPLIKTYQARGIPFTNGYGITEGTGYNLFLPPADVIDRTGAYLPLMYNRIMVADEEGRPVPVDEIGELLIGGPVVMKEYWRDPERTAETIRDGWLRTGDVARRDADNYVYPVDRIKDMVITGGLNVYPAEVENVLFAHPHVVDVAVVGLEHERWGEAVTAFVVRQEATEATPDDLLAYCREELADYKQPKRIEFVEEIPRNVSGKVLKRELRDNYADLYANAR